MTHPANTVLDLADVDALLAEPAVLGPSDQDSARNLVRRVERAVIEKLGASDARGELALTLQSRNRHLDMPTARYYVDAVFEAIEDQKADSFGLQILNRHREHRTDDIAVDVCRAVAELPDRNSPADWPEAMLVTYDELHRIVHEALAQARQQGRNEGYEEARAEQRELVVDNKFMRAWVGLDALPGSMMQGPEGLFGPIPASTSCWITTSEREVERMRHEGPAIEVWVARQPAQGDVL